MKLSENGPAHFDSADRLADAIIARVGKKIVLALPLGLGKANHVANALFARAAADSSISLRIFTALTLEKPRPSSELERRFIGPIAERCFGGYPDLAYAVALRKGLPPNVDVDEFFFQAGTRLGIAAAQQSYISANYTHALGCVLQRGVNVVGQLVAKRARGGATRYSLSCNPDITLDLLAKRQNQEADFLFVGQVNSELPFMPGEGDLAADAFDVILDSPQTDFPLFAPPREPIDLAEYAAGLRVAGIVADGGTLQLGIGALGDAVAQALILRHKNNAGFRDLMRALDASATAPPAMIEEKPFEAGLFGASEMFVEGFLELFHAGILRREVEGVLLHAAFFVGSRAFYRELREMPPATLEKFRMTAVSYVNEIYGDEAAKRRARVKARFVNGAMMATVLGAVVSDGLENGQVVSGVGGQYNFIAQGFALQDARSIIMLRATRTAKGRASSNIRWQYGHATIPRHLRDIVVTEYGVADLRGKTDRDVIAAMLAVTDSRFQDELLRQAKDAGKIEKRFELPPAWRDNTPRRIERALAGARAEGLLASFPFESDFTPTEQRLLPALEALKSALASPLGLVGFLARGLGGAAHSAEIGDCLTRMGLARPSGLAERAYAVLLRGALRS
ncbi:MAG TPA: acetyl-CoA hydrolase/transferase C-terminal domain-containing protein [Xanthobacteraceae bacterium]|jgi:acyl-CoA hydrolase|nr:acetyl-CoA hydrolase/transferase C-terminal domain-containing protein [Xanthobacteraceae bacterium]